MLKAELNIRDVCFAAGLGIIIGTFVAFKGNPVILGNMIILGAGLMFVPAAILNFLEYRAIKAMENVFPTFLQDVAEWVKSGLTLPQAIEKAKQGDYGRLNKEIERLYIQISWGIPVQEALKTFAERTKSSIIKKACEIIVESYLAGGEIDETLDSLARDLTVLKTVEEERKHTMLQHVITMYVVYFIFVVMIVVLCKVMTPVSELKKYTNVGGESTILQGTALTGLEIKTPLDYCAENPEFRCIAVWGFQAVGDVLGLGRDETSVYKGMFLVMLLIQGIFSGLMCGEIQENSARAGIRHALIMTLGGLTLFMITVRAGVI